MSRTVGRIGSIIGSEQKLTGWFKLKKNYWKNVGVAHITGKSWTDRLWKRQKPGQTLQAPLSESICFCPNHFLSFYLASKIQIPIGKRSWLAELGLCDAGHLDWQLDHNLLQWERVDSLGELREIYGVDTKSRGNQHFAHSKNAECNSIYMKFWKKQS